MTIKVNDQVNCEKNVEEEKKSKTEPSKGRWKEIVEVVGIIAMIAAIVLAAILIIGSLIFACICSPVAAKIIVSIAIVTIVPTIALVVKGMLGGLVA